jgi:hypothetical protein
MSEAESKPINIPWAPLLALIATIAGLSALLPSRSARPSAAGIEVSLPRGKEVSARLWQDPLQVVSEAEARRLKDTQSKDGNTGKPDWGELKVEFDKLILKEQSPLVLMVCVPDSPYAEDVERRLRDRTAVLQALAAEGYVPRHSTVLKYVLSNDCRYPNYALPFESFGPLDKAFFPPQAPDTQRRNILIVWIGDGYLGDQPLSGLAGVVKHLIDEGESDASQEPRKLPEVRILGPSSTGQYRKMLEELEQATTQAFAETKRLLSHAQVYSCKATGADSVLREGVEWVGNDRTGESADAVQKRMREGVPDSHFFCARTTATDEQFCAALWKELKQRRIKNDAHIAVLSELDSFYGRASIRTFVTTIPSEGMDRQLDSRHVHTYFYMAGIDGALPKNALGIEEKTSKEESLGANAPSPLQEATEGHSQLDYFRRLADALAQENQRLIASAQKGEEGKTSRDGFKAVIVLGSDIYDKLQILRTLRPRLSTALFMTNGLDARFGHPDEWEETRNLIVAAGQPLRLNWPANDNSPLPFRDSIQTSVYLAARHALNATDQFATNDYPTKDWRGRAQLFEIGKRGPVPLGIEGLDVGNQLEVPRWGPIIIGVGVLIAIFLLVRCQTARPFEKSASEGVWQRLYLWFSRADLAVPGALLMSGGVTCMRYCLQKPSTAEPFALYDGISIGPGDFVRLFVFFLAIHFVCKILIGLENNAQNLAADFGLVPALAERRTASSGEEKWSPIRAQGSRFFGQIKLHERINQLWPHTEPPKGGHVDARSVLMRYYGWTTPGKRCLRALAYLILYLILMFAIVYAFPSANPDLPVRGGAWGFSIGILFAAVIAMLFVTFLVVDATTVNCLFIRDLNSGHTDWNLNQTFPPQSQFKFSNYLAMLEPDDCADYLDIQYIARRSDIVNRLIYFPFILVALLIAARWSKTDGYTWSGMLVVIFALNVSSAIYCAIRLPIEARAARSETLRRLRCNLFRRRAAEAVEPPPRLSNAVALKAVISEIENLRQGAFVGIWEQPLLRAILVPSGGVGLWALLDLIPS